MGTRRQLLRTVPALALLGAGGPLPLGLGTARAQDASAPAPGDALRDAVHRRAIEAIGIEKGKPFSPDAGRRQALDAAAADAHGLLDDAFARSSTPPGPRLFDKTWVLPDIEQVA